MPGSFRKLVVGLLVGAGSGVVYIQQKYVAFDDWYQTSLVLQQRPALQEKHARNLGGIPYTYYTEGKVQEATGAPVPLTDHHTKAVDVCVVGGGFAGLHTALAAAEKGKSVVVLEARRVGCRASGRNGGDAIIGFHTEVDDIAAITGEAAAKEIYSHSVMGYERLKGLIKGYDIRCGAKEEGAVTVAFRKRLDHDHIVDAEEIDSLRKHAASVKQRFGEEIEIWDKETLEKRGISSDRFAYGVFNPKNLTLNPLELALGLARAVRTKGGHVYEASPVTSIVKLPKSELVDEDKWLVTTEMGSVVAKNVVLATNGAPRHLSLKLHFATAPLVTAMMLTKSIDKQELDKVLTAKCAVFDERFALAYFRRVEGNRILFGSLASGVPMQDSYVRRALVDDLTATFPSLKGMIEPDVTWQGRLEARLPVFPLIGRDSSGLWYSLGYSGHGLVPTCAAGELIASAIASQENRKDGSKGKPDERYKLWGLVSYGPAIHNVPSFLPPTFLPVGGPIGMLFSPIYCQAVQLLDSFHHKC